MNEEKTPKPTSDSEVGVEKLVRRDAVADKIRFKKANGTYIYDGDWLTSNNPNLGKVERVQVKYCEEAGALCLIDGESWARNSKGGRLSDHLGSWDAVYDFTVIKSEKLHSA